MNRVFSLWRCCAFAGAAVLLVAATAAAQFDRGQISGRVRDAQGAVVPGATVLVTNNQTQIQWTAVSDGTGFYTFPNLSAGQYTVSSELQGFKKALRQDVQLDAAGSLTLDFTLETGAVTEEVTVTAERRAADRHRAAQDDRVARHRAAVVLGPQPDRRRRPQGRASSAAASTTTTSRISATAASASTAAAATRTTSRWTARRRSARGRRRDRRHPERRRDPGSPGPDRRLHAGVRPRQRRPDPHGHQERRQPLQRQRLVLLPRRQAPGQHVDAQQEPERRSRTAARRRSTTSSTGTRSAARS